MEYQFKFDNKRWNYYRSQSDTNLLLRTNITDYLIDMIDNMKHLSKETQHLLIDISRQIDTIKLETIKRYITEKKINLEVVEVRYIILYIICSKGIIKYIDPWITYCNKKKFTIDIHYYNEQAFISACRNKQFETIKYLIEYCESHNTPINIHAGGKYILTYLCIHAQYDIIKYLLKYSIILNNLFYIDNITILEALKINNVNILELLLEYSITTKNIIKLEIIKDISKLDFLQCIVNYYEKINNKYKKVIHYRTLYIYYCMINRHYNIIDYLFYLYKHNYRFDGDIFINHDYNNNKKISLRHSDYKYICHTKISKNFILHSCKWCNSVYIIHNYSVIYNNILICDIKDDLCTGYHNYTLYIHL